MTTKDKTEETGLMSKVSGQLQQLLALGSLIVLLIFFSIANSNFGTFGNLTQILLNTSVIGILALSATIVILTGGIDLSVGTGMTMCAVATGLVTVNMGAPLVIGMLAGLAMGALMGFINGFNVAVLDLPPFIATLAMMMVAQGGALVASGVQPIYFNDNPNFKLLAGGMIIPGVPNGVLVLFGLAIIASVLLSRTLFGRYTYAMGSNLEAARLSGIDTKRWLIGVYTVAGLFTGAGGVLLASRLNSAQPALGVGYELEAIAAVIIGGTSLSGGRGTIYGTMIGALIMAVLKNGLQIMGVADQWQKILIGVVILFAVFMDRLRSKN